MKSAICLAAISALTLALLSGCAQMSYYSQAASGQLSLLYASRPVDDWIADATTDAKLKQRLLKAKQIRQFAVSELHLPDNGSYKNYTDLHRSFVVWNVVATPELSLKPRQWCFPIAGCVNYHGYYSKEAALEFAAELRKEGDDVQVYGVTAYSTLGWFNDPFLSTYIRSPDTELARLVFHELAHQVVYIKDDSQFNESFATTVEEVGVDRWLTAVGDDQMRARHVAATARKEQFLDLLLKHRKTLELLYQSNATDDEKRMKKKAVFAALQDDYQALKTSWNGFAGYDLWFAEPLSNAHLASVATYHDLVPGFRALLAQQKDFDGFYRAVKALARMDKSTRQERLLKPALPGR